MLARLLLAESCCFAKAPLCELGRRARESQPYDVSDSLRMRQALVEFAEEASANHALEFHKRNMGSRYVEVFKSNWLELNHYLGRSGARGGAGRGPACAAAGGTERAAAEQIALECCVCMQGSKTHIFIPCGHLCVCHKCGEGLMASSKACPICQQVSSSCIKVWKV